MGKMKIGENETFKNSCVIYRRKMTLAFAFPSPRETVQYSLEPAAKKKKKGAATAAMGFTHAIVGWHQMKPRARRAQLAAVVVTIADEK